MMNGKSKLSIIALFLMIFLGTASGIEITELEINPSEPGESEEFSIYTEATDYQNYVDEIWIEWEEKPSNWDSEIDSVSCGVTVCDQEWEDITFEEEGDYDFEILAFSLNSVDQATRTGTVEVREIDEPEVCDIDSGQLNLSPDEIEISDSTTASVEVNNNGNSQDVKVRFETSGDIKTTSLRNIQSGESRTFSANLHPDETSEVTADIITRGDPCGDQTLKTKSAHITVKELKKATFEIANLGINNVDEGEIVVADFTVENTGDKSATQEIEFETRDSTGYTYTKRDTTTVKLDGGESKGISLYWNTDTSDAGDYVGRVKSEDASRTDSFRVFEKDVKEAFFDVEITGTNSPVTEEETLTVDYKIENTGEQTGTQTIELSVGDITRDTTSRTVSSGETVYGTLSWSTTTSDEGSYTARLRSEDSQDSRIVEVEKKDRDPEAVLDIHPDPAKTSETVTFDATQSSAKDSNTIRTYKYDFENTGTWNVVTTRDSVTRSFDTSGTRTARLQVEDDRGNTATTTQTYEIKEREPKQDAFFDVEITGTNSPVTEGDPLIIDYRVENTGEQTGTQTIELVDYHGNTVDTVTLTLSESESRTGTLHWNTEINDAGDRQIELRSENSVDTETVEILERDIQEALFDVELTGTNSPIREGDTLLVNYRIENTGEQTDTQNIRLEIDGTEEARASRTLSPGSSRTGTLRWTTQKSDEGSYTASISSDDTTDSRNIRVDRRTDPVRDPEAVLDIHPDPAKTSETVTFDATQSSAKDSDSIRRYYYDYKNDGSWNRVTTRDSVSRSFDSTGSFTARLKVEDSNGRTDTTTRSYTIESRDKQVDDEKAELDVTVRDQDSNRLEDVRVRAENSDSVTRFTDSNGEAYFRLNPDRYDIKASKSGYHTETRSIRLRDGDRRSISFTLEEKDDVDPGRDIEIRNLDFPDTVCRGDSMRAEFDLVNNRDKPQNVQLSGRGLSSITVRGNVYIGPEETKSSSLRFTNIQGQGDEEFTIRVTNSDTTEATRTVRVEDCAPDRDPGTASRITMNLDPQSVFPGEAVRVSGYVDGTRGRKNVDITLDGEDAGRVTTQPDGYYQTFIRPEEVGDRTVTASTDNVRQNRRLEVLPTATVSHVNVDTPVFQGEEFEVCGEVDSQKIPKVLLLKNGEIVDSKNAKGEVCFERQEFERGEVDYEIRAIARNQHDSASKRVEILETDVEARNFPDKVSQVRSGPGIVRLTLHNNEPDLKRYDLKLEGLPSSWTAQSDKQVILEPGETKETFFYLTPKQEGERTADLKVEVDGSVIYDQPIEVRTGGTTKTNKNWFERIKTRFGL